MEQAVKLFKPSQIAEEFGIKAEVVRNMCHARGQKFAIRFKPNGRFYIDREKFIDHLERKQDQTRENRGW
jgi:hypothetical protein